MNKKSGGIVLTLVTLAVGLSAFELSRALRLRAQQSDRTPFTAFMVENQYPAGQSLPDHTEYYLRAVRRDTGEVTVSRRHSPRQEWMNTRVILDFPGGRRVSVDPFTESLTTYPLSRDTATDYQASLKADCTGSTNLEHSSLLGYEVVKVHKDLPGPPGSQTTIESFEAPALDCFAVEEDWTLGSSQGLERKITRQALFIIKGEPDSALFELPSYQERSPSQVLAEFQRRYPEHHPFPESDHGLDKVYHDAQK